MLSDAIPCSSANATAASSTLSLPNGLRGFVAGLVFGAIYFLPGQHS